MSRLTELFSTKKILVSDGAWGTYLFQKGLKSGECPEEWNISHKESVLDIARIYSESGSDIISTNSFGGSRIKLKQYGLDQKTTELNRTAAQISREASGNQKFIFGSIGPTGKFLITGDVTEQELYNSFSEQAEALADGGVDAILLETFYDISEAVIAIDAAKNATGLDVICSFTFDRQPDNSFKTLMGLTPSVITERLLQTGIVAVGSNCGSGFENLSDIATEIRRVTKEFPLLIQANAGIPVLKDSELIYTETPESITPFVRKLIETGVNIIGGCCGTNQQHIKTIRQIVDIHNASI